MTKGKVAVMTLRKGRFEAFEARGKARIDAALALRARVFRPGACGEHADADRFDALCRHLVVYDSEGGRLACCFRILPLASGAEISRSYSAQFYDLSPMAHLPGPMAEVGRFCIAPEFATDPDLLRVAWGAMTRLVDAAGVRMLFGCSSFAGTEPATHAEAFALLGRAHVAPPAWRPAVKAPEVVRFAALGPGGGDRRRALRAMPPLLRSYLAMGGRVSDHAVVDRDLGTLHVFTGLPICAIPRQRVRALRRVADHAGAPAGH